ncbi:mannosyltransferase [Pantoea sp. Ap-967]|uniref:dermonecrotic toxin domain-containing protein n=1 Tax=Pantoea sp. Ap-967 TaxID=2608362 RepID=UPI00141E8F44|nr:DUF6543 domain-containing protein [Pantoea sp. Ap-967]NIE76279.1 mannosyltransferase [Pantoea sp. Ap-967]
MTTPAPLHQPLLRNALVDFPRPDTLAETLLRDWLGSRGITLSPLEIDVVTLHYQYTRLDEDPAQYRLNAQIRQRVNLVEALLGNWQGEPAGGYNGFHYGDWAGIAPPQAVTVVERLEPLSAWSNSAPYMVFNGLYRRSASQAYGPATRLAIRAEDFQSYVWGLALHGRLKQALNNYWGNGLQRYARALKIAFISACNKQVSEGSLSEPARRLAWQAAGLLPGAPQVQCRLLNVYGYVSTSLLYIQGPDSNAVLLYVPGNSSPLHQFDNELALKHWFASQCQDSDRQQWLQQYFSPSTWPDGLQYSGLGTALQGLGLYPRPHRLPIDHPGFASSGVWNPDDTVNYAAATHSPPITGDLFDYLAQQQKQRSYDDMDYRVVTNHQVDKRRWGSYLSISVGMLGPFALVLPELIPVLVLGGLAQFGLGLDQAINGHTLDEQVEGLENQAFGLLNAAPLAAGVARASQLFSYLRPGFLRAPRLAELLGPLAGSATPVETFELLPAEYAFRAPAPQNVQAASVVTRVDEALNHYFEGRFETAGDTRTEPVVYDLQGDCFIKASEHQLPAPQRWVFGSGASQALVHLADLQRTVSDAQRIATLQQLGIRLDLPIDYAFLDNLERTPIPRIISSLWVGDQRISGLFLDALAHNAAAVQGTDYQYQLFLSRQNPRVYQANLRQLQARAPQLSVHPLEDEAFYQDFARSPYFRQYQAALGDSGSHATNFSSASDILRYRVLKHFGGLYLDADDRLFSIGAGPGRLPLANHTLQTTADGLLLSPPVSSDQLGLYIKYNSSMIGSHPNNPTLDAISDEILRRFQQDPLFYTGRPDAVFNPVGFNAYAKRLNRLTGPGVLNDVIDTRLPWLRQLRELCSLLVSPVHDLHSAINLRELTRLMREHAPLDRFVEMGQAHSWQYQ